MEWKTFYIKDKETDTPTGKSKEYPEVDDRQQYAGSPSKTGTVSKKCRHLDQADYSILDKLESNRRSRDYSSQRVEIHDHHLSKLYQKKREMAQSIHQSIYPRSKSTIVLPSKRRNHLHTSLRQDQMTSTQKLISESYRKWKNFNRVKKRPTFNLQDRMSLQGGLITSVLGKVDSERRREQSKGGMCPRTMRETTQNMKKLVRLKSKKKARKHHLFSLPSQRLLSLGTGAYHRLLRAQNKKIPGIKNRSIIKQDGSSSTTTSNPHHPLPLVEYDSQQVGNLRRQIIKWNERRGDKKSGKISLRKLMSNNVRPIPQVVDSTGSRMKDQEIYINNQKEEDTDEQYCQLVNQIYVPNRQYYIQRRADYQEEVYDDQKTDHPAISLSLVQDSVRQENLIKKLQSLFEEEANLAH